MGFNPSQFKNPAHPVENINRWEDTQEFIARLNAFNDGYRYRLPTEAEWEYAARAGTTSMFIGNPDDAGWYAQNSNRQTHPVGQKQPNAWGLYDMLGNVSEWVSDWYDPVYYAVSPALDPAGPATGSLHSLRGGSAALMPVELRVSYRGNRPYIGNASYIYGFRIVRESAP
jgi:formylglycine-generating enzyme required for sulfatase activity